MTPSRILFLALSLSFIFHVGFRNRHFQEIDSSFVHGHLTDFPRPQLWYLRESWAYPKKDGRRPWLSLFRESLVMRLENLHLPGPLRSMWALPLGSTYSMGSGLVYGLLGGATLPYFDFMSRATLVTLLLFHLTVLLLFFTIRNLGATPFSATGAALWLLFSISHYSYGFHLGNTVWNFSTSMFWIWWLGQNLRHPQLEKRISVATAILTYLNYLIPFYWLGFVAAIAWRDGKKNKRPLSVLTRLLKSQAVAIAAIAICSLLLVQIDQGNRGTVETFKELFPALFYICLNYFSLFNRGVFAEWTQFVLGIVACSLAVRWVLLRVSKPSPSVELNLFVLFTTCTFLAVGLAMITGYLGLSPLRHILFLSPLVFTTIGLALSDTRIELWLGRWSIHFLTAAVIIGLAGLSFRRQSVEDVSLLIGSESGIDGIILERPSFLASFQNRTRLPVMGERPLKTGNSYLYLSSKAYYVPKGPVEIIDRRAIINDAYFLAYNPRRPLSNQPNDLYLTRFKVLHSENQK